MTIAQINAGLAQGQPKAIDLIDGVAVSRSYDSRFCVAWSVYDENGRSLGLGVRACGADKAVVAAKAQFGDRVKSIAFACF